MSCYQSLFVILPSEIIVPLLKKYIFVILLIGDLQQIRYVGPMLFYCWASVADNGPT